MFASLCALSEAKRLIGSKASERSSSQKSLRIRTAKEKKETKELETKVPEKDNAKVRGKDLDILQTTLARAKGKASHGNNVGGDLGSFD